MENKLEKENERLKARIKDLIEYIKELGEIGDVCTYNTTKEICEGCRCKRWKATASSTK